MPRGPRRGAFFRLCAARRTPLCAAANRDGFATVVLPPKVGGRVPAMRPLPGDRATDGGTRPSAKTPPRLADRRGEALAPWGSFSWPLWRQLAKFGRLGSRLLVTRPPALEQRPTRFPRRPLGVHAFPPGPPSTPSPLVVGHPVIGHSAPSGAALPSPCARARGGKTKYEGKSSRR